MESLESIYNNKGWVVVVVVQPIWKFYINYLISTTDYGLNALQYDKHNIKLSSS